MKYWPVPDSYSKSIPINSSPGSFWKDRDDRYHCGVDIYAPQIIYIILVEDGKVIDIDIFTSSDKISYWNTTYHVLLKNKTGFVCKYAELRDILVKKGMVVKTGELIGHVGLVLNTDQSSKQSPQYIQRLNNNNKQSMLHFELYISEPNNHKYYSGGNWFGTKKPNNLLDPTNYLSRI